VGVDVQIDIGLFVMELMSRNQEIIDKRAIPEPSPEILALYQRG
jgi:hypothetical protein